MEFTKVYNRLCSRYFKHKLPLVIVCLSTVVLTCCSLFEEKYVCPRIGLIEQAHQTIYYRSSEGHDLTDVAHEVVIENITYECEYDFDGDESSVEIFLNVLISARRGPAATDNMVKIPFFVAIADSEKNVLSKDIFTSAIGFSGNETSSMAVEELVIAIPFNSQQDIYKFKAYLGLQLTSEQFEDYKLGRDR